MQVVRHDLDDGGRHALVVGVTSSGLAWAELRHSSGDRRSRVHEALCWALRIQAGDRSWQFAADVDRVAFDPPATGLAVELLVSPPRTILRVDGQGRAEATGDRYRLSHFETRFLADNGAPHAVPEGQQDSPALLATDLHSHFAGCLAPNDLLRIAVNHDVLWPSRVLALAGVATDGSAPLRTSSFSPQVLARLGASMVAPEDRQITFLEMERIYAVRGPVTKHRGALPDLCRRIARDYEAMGVRYVELSLSVVVEQAVLRTLHEVIPAIEQETGVKLRFLAAMSRHDDLEWDLDYLDRLEQVLDSPYIVGVDFMGHETNSTLAFARQIGEASERAARRRPRFVIRVHAGENPAHPENVRMAAEATRGHDVQLRVGHGLYGVDEVTLRLLAQLDAIVEFNLNSNLALNNILATGDVPLRKYIDAGVPAVLGTDGYGIYQTSMAMEARAARLAGVGDDGLAWIRATEERYVAMRLAADAGHTALPGTWEIPPDAPGRHYTQEVGTRKREAAEASRRGWTTRLEQARVREIEPDEVRAIAAGRTAILFAGAWANAWRGMTPDQQARVTETVRGVLEERTNADTLVVTGGTQFGVEGVAAQAAIARGIDVLGVLVRDLNASSVADDSLTFAVFVGTTLYEKGAALYGLLRELDGGVLFLGGGPIVHDEIQTASNLRIPHLLMKGVGGASARQAALRPEAGFATAKDALRVIRGWAEAASPQGAYWHIGPNPTADAVVFRKEPVSGARQVLLIKRDDDAPAEAGRWALPGGFVASASPRGVRWEPGPESVEQACVRELREETGLDISAAVERMVLVGVYERGGRDPRDTAESWSQSTAYVIEVMGEESSRALAGGDDAAEARWFSIDALPRRLAFDHERIVREADEVMGGAIALRSGKDEQGGGEEGR